MSLIDATYKTTTYDLQLFFLTVRTNVGHKVVAHFIVQSETTEQILEALKIGTKTGSHHSFSVTILKQKFLQ